MNATKRGDKASSRCPSSDPQGQASAPVLPFVVVLREDRHGGLSLQTIAPAPREPPCRRPRNRLFQRSLEGVVEKVPKRGCCPPIKSVHRHSGNQCRPRREGLIAGMTNENFSANGKLPCRGRIHATRPFCLSTTGRIYAAPTHPSPRRNPTAVIPTLRGLFQQTIEGRASRGGKTDPKGLLKKSSHLPHPE